MALLARWRIAVPATFAALLCSAATAAAADPPSLVADTSQPGVVNLVYFGVPGSRVYFDERVGDSVKRLGSAQIGQYGGVVLPHATIWRCDRLVRRFEATGVAPNGARSRGAFDVRTGSCSNRLELVAPRRVAPGGTARIRVRDRWQIGGIKPKLCIARPRAKLACRVLKLDRGTPASGRRFRATHNGLWRIELRVGNRRIRTHVGVGATKVPRPPPVVLATGDSTMQGIDSFLTDRLAAEADVLSKLYIGTSISRTGAWVHRAASQAAKLRPAKTVVSLGANDDSDMQALDGSTVRCCDALWSAEYARRARTMMKSYLRRGKGRVVWATLPATRDLLRTAIGVVINRSIRKAADGLRGVTILPFDLIFTPFGYREDMRWRGQTVRVRAPDGIHLSAAGTAIAAEVIEAALDDL